MSDENAARLDAILKRKRLRRDEITVEKNEGAPDGYGWGAWIGIFELGCLVGTGRTADEAIEDLVDQLED